MEEQHSSSEEEEEELNSSEEEQQHNSSSSDEDEDDMEDEQNDMEEENVEDHDNRVLNLMMSTFSGTKDMFGKETVPPLPLLLDQISEGQLSRAEAPLLKLPSGVLGEIVLYLEPSSLASFALVNRDCLQLARSRRFASVLFDYSEFSFDLIKELLSECRERLSNGTTSQPSIGACIRRITVATDATWLIHRHGIQRVADASRVAAASRTFFDYYLNALTTILACRVVLPHLELLDFEDRIVIPERFIETLACSSIKHLRLYRVMIDEEYRIEIPDVLSSGRCWPLQTLHLEVHWDFFTERRKEGSTASLCASILRLCALTLVSLTWDTVSDESLHSLTADSEDPLRFPCLRELRLGNIKFSDSASIDALIGGNLVLLVADTEKTDIHLQCFEKRGTIHSLETFVWDRVALPRDHPLDFLRANPQLSKLSLLHPAPLSCSGKRLLPLLSSSFKNLISLSPIWEGLEIPISALQIISTLKSLEQIHLSAGHQFGWKHDWRIDHKSMRRYLRSLPHIKKIAFSRDSYDNGISGVSRYYVDKYDDQFLFMDGQDQNKVWERLHRSRISAEALKYVQAVPQLEWLYIGQLPMTVRASAHHSARYADPLSTERDDCYTLLRKMFDGEAK